jgi:uridine phosphorylase
MKGVFENLTVEEWNKRTRHKTEVEETHIILTIKNHKTLSTGSQFAMIALSMEEEQQLKDYFNFARPKSLQNEFFLKERM